MARSNWIVVALRPVWARLRDEVPTAEFLTGLPTHNAWAQRQHGWIAPPRRGTQPTSCRCRLLRRRAPRPRLRRDTRRAAAVRGRPRHGARRGGRAQPEAPRG